MTYRSKAILWILGVFLTGTVFGSTCAYLWVRSQTEPIPQGAPPPPLSADSPERRDNRRGPRPEGEIRAIAQALDLDDEQRTELRRIFQETKERYDGSQRQHWMQQRQIRQDMLRSIRSMLRSDQQTKLDDFLKAQQERFRRAREERARRRSQEDERR